MTTDDFQPELMTLDGVEWEDKMVDEADLPPNNELMSPPPTSLFKREIEDRGGVQVPILVAILPDQEWFIIAGNRRIKAARLTRFSKIPARFAHMTLQQAMLMRSAENNQRSDNSMVDLAAIKFVMTQYPGSSAAFIGRLTGIPTARVNKLLNYAKLPSEIISGVSEGVVQSAAAQHLAKLPARYQQRAVELLNYRQADPDKPRGYLLTANDVDALQRERKEAASLLLPLIPEFDEPEILGYMLWDKEVKQFATGLMDNQGDIETAFNEMHSAGYRTNNLVSVKIVPF